MTKWDYIQLISQRGSHYGYAGGIYDLLSWCEKENTMSVTLEEARDFWEGWPQSLLAGSGRNSYGEKV